MSRFLYYSALVVWALGASVPSLLMSTNLLFRGSIQRNFVFWAWYNRMFCALFFRITHVCHEKLDAKKQYIFLPNHHSSLDGCLVYLCYPVSVVALVKSSLRKIPFLGACFEKLSFVFVDREKKGSITERMISMLAQTNLSLLLFPEGTRNYVPRTLKELRTGAFVIACSSGIPIVPIRYNILDKVNDQRTAFYWGVKTKVIFGSAIETKGRDVASVMEEYRRFHDTELSNWNND